MPVLVIAQFTIHDRARYDRYAAAFMPVLMKHGGRLLAADEAPQVLEGTWPHQKVVVISFNDEESARRWMTSPEYQEIAKDRIAATQGPVLLVHGFEPRR